MSGLDRPIRDPRRGQDVYTDQLRLRNDLRQLLVRGVGDGLSITSLGAGTTITQRKDNESEITGVFGNRIAIRNVDLRTLPAWSIAQSRGVYDTDTTRLVLNVCRPEMFGLWENVIWIPEEIKRGHQGYGYYGGLMATTVVSDLTPAWDYWSAPEDVRGRYNWIESGYHCSTVPGEHILALEGGFAQPGDIGNAVFQMTYRIASSFVIVAVLDHISYCAAYRIANSIRRGQAWVVAKVCLVYPSGGWL